MPRKKKKNEGKAKLGEMNDIRAVCKLEKEIMAISPRKGQTGESGRRKKNG